MPSLKAKRYSLSELDEINELIIPLKALADRERASIYGLTGMVYTPYIDDYMQASVNRAEILAGLKKQGLLALSQVEIISTALDLLYKRARNNTVVEYDGNSYQRRFSPLKLSKSGKVVRIWAKFWLLQSASGRVDHVWESEVREIWPTYFIIQGVDI